MHSFDFVPKYLESIIYAEADMEQNYRMNRNERNRIQHDLIHLALNKLFTSWHRGCKSEGIKKILRLYIQKLVARSARYRLRSTVGSLEESKIKYEATRRAVSILLNVYKLVGEGTV